MIKLFKNRKSNFDGSRNPNNYYQIIRKCYLQVLNREPDDLGLNHYLNLMKKNQLDESGLLDILINSDEYKRKKAAQFYDTKKPYVIRGLYDIFYVIHPNSVLDDIIVKNGIYDKWITSALGKLIPTTGIIFDIGANAGLLSLPFAKQYVHNGLVYAFEPDSEILPQLEQNINFITNMIQKVKDKIGIGILFQVIQSFQVLKVWNSKW